MFQFLIDTIYITKCKIKVSRFKLIAKNENIISEMAILEMK